MVLRSNGMTSNSKCLPFTGEAFFFFFSVSHPFFRALGLVAHKKIGISS